MRKLRQTVQEVGPGHGATLVLTPESMLLTTDGMGEMAHGSLNGSKNTVSRGPQDPLRKEWRVPLCDLRTLLTDTHGTSSEVPQHTNSLDPLIYEDTQVPPFTSPTK